MRTVYEFNGNICFSENDVDNAIESQDDEPVNNCDPHDYIGFASIWEYDVYELDADAWDTFKMWCEQENLKPSHASSVERYYKELE